MTDEEKLDKANKERYNKAEEVEYFAACKMYKLEYALKKANTAYYAAKEEHEIAHIEYRAAYKAAHKATYIKGENND